MNAAVPAKKSTTVRFKAGAMVTLLRATFGVLERVAPAAGTRLALRLWCTPPRRRSPGRGPATGGGPAGPSARGERLEVPVAGGRIVVARSWGRGPIVYLVHGWGGWPGQLDAFVAPLVASGCRVVAYDALGHGESDAGTLGPRRSTLPELAATLAEVVAAVGPAYGIVGHSLGGSAALLAVLDGTRAGRLVTVGALADPISYTSDFAAAMGLGERIRGRFVQRLEVLVGRAAADFDLSARSRATAAVASGTAAVLPPLLVVHDREDKETRYADGVALAAAWPGAELATTTGLGHRRILRDPGVVARVVEFVTGRVATGGDASGPGVDVVADLARTDTGATDVTT